MFIMRARLIPKCDRGDIMRELQRGHLRDLDWRSLVNSLHELLRGKVLVRSSGFGVH